MINFCGKIMLTKQLYKVLKLVKFCTSVLYTNFQLDRMYMSFFKVKRFSLAGRTSIIGGGGGGADIHIFVFCTINFF